MVTIASQFNGPDTTGNGGYVCGLLAGEHAAGGGRPDDETGIVTSTLRLPPPLDSPLTWERHDDLLALLTTGGAIVGEAKSGAFDADPPQRPTPTEVVEGQASYPGLKHHPFARCFTCGTARAEGDGLRIFSGPVDDARTAAEWTPDPAFDSGDGRVDIAVTWAALDCPGGWAADFTAQVMLLGRMTGQVLRRPAIGEPHAVTGVLVERDGRKFRTSTAIYAPDGDLIGRSEQIWIEIPEPV